MYAGESGYNCGRYRAIAVFKCGYSVRAAAEKVGAK